jgi:hypothetical protein
MKAYMLKITAIVMMMAGGFSSCGEREENIFSEPIEIPVTEYSLYETGCWWINTEPDKVIVINSDKDLEKYIACTDNSCSYPVIDFSKQTLLLTNGIAYNGVGKISNTFLQVGSEKYTWKISVRLGDTMVVQEWYTAILVPKLTNKVIIVTEVQQTHF